MQMFKIYRPDGELVASVKYAMDAAILIGYQGEGATVSLGRRKWQTVYTVEDSKETLDSFDRTAQAILDNTALVFSEQSHRIDKRRKRVAGALTIKSERKRE